MQAQSYNCTTGTHLPTSEGQKAELVGWLQAVAEIRSVDIGHDKVQRTVLQVITECRISFQATGSDLRLQL